MLLSFQPAVHLLLAAWATGVAADFQLYKFYSQEALIAGLALSDKCLDALNATVKCNETAINFLGDGGADIHYWTVPEVENLCTKDCVSSLDSWRSNVDKVCDEETTIQAGVIVKARALPLTFTYNADLVCTQDTESNWCFVDSQKWQGSDYIRYDPVMCFPNGDDNTTMAPECEDPDFDVDIISDEMAALTNLYGGDLYCSECFLKLYRQRLLDPWLPVTNFTDYLIKEFDSVQKNCSTTLSYRTSASTLYVGPATTSTPTTSTAPGTTSGTASGNATTTTSASSTATPTCLGQEVKPVESWLTCNDLSDKYNISTGDARVYTGDYSCYFEEPVCVPLPCELDVVWDEPSCDKLAERYSNETDKITTNQFLSWNPNIQGSCSGIARGQRVCKSAPGGTYHKPNSTITAPNAHGTSPTYYTRTTPAHPTQSGTTPDCGRYHLVVAGDDCWTVAQRFGLNLTQLREYNPFLKPDCRNLWLDYAVCVAPVAEEAVSEDGTCPRGVKCEGSGFGECCSPWGFCGSGEEYCVGGGNNGTGTTDGTCGPENGGTTCRAPFGECCSIYGFCGGGDDFCGAGNCYSGKCEPDIGGPSTDGACGPDFAGNKTCVGTQFGKCCSVAGYCGSTGEFCDGKNCYSGECT